ncbi:MAG: response regulator [Candidatus Pacebacteria bacterium]|nr:response regulator [Candidatus Paceibacterota bacterium]
MSEPTPNQEKIMFVDDDSFLLDMYAVKLKNQGYDVRICDNAEAALKILHDGYVPDAVLIDMIMPEMDGIGFLATLRKEGLAAKAALIMLTNQGLPDDIAQAKKLNVDGYIIKATTIPSDVLRETEKILAAKNK